MKTLESFIATEREYFKPMQDREKRSTTAQREQWKKETVRERQQRISLEVFDSCNGVVKYGPFKGLRLDQNTWWGQMDLGSQCLGLYEKEILNVIEATPNQTFSTFIDIGAADGYYAVGMLVSGKVKKTICFEEMEKGREVIASNWKNNGSPGALTIWGEANAKSIAGLSPVDLKNALVLVDIEGFEFELLTEEALGLLRSCTLILEVHNWVEEFTNKYENLLRTASKYFSIEPIERTDRSTAHLAELRDFTDDNRLLLTSERRPCLMRFLKFSPIVV